MARAELGKDPIEPIKPLDDAGWNRVTGDLLPNYARYRRWGCYPDGTWSREKQSQSLLDDFDVLDHMLAVEIQTEKRQK